MIAPAELPKEKSRRANSGLFGGLARQPPDSLLALIGLYRNDSRAGKIDVGVGVYRDEQGCTPVFRAVKAAERRLLDGQTTKGYLGPEGDVEFFDRLAPIIFGSSLDAAHLGGLQTPGGTGALRLAAELVAAARPRARVMVGMPTWPNHLPILAVARLEAVPYVYFDVGHQAILFDEMVLALERAQAGDVVLLQGCCHNPVGADLDSAQWGVVAGIVERRGLVPLIDLAYQGLGHSLEEDAAGARLVFDGAEEALLAYSCDKNFGLYRERTGALFVKSRSGADALKTQSNLLSLARANWSMPPDHGAAVVRTILQDTNLTTVWRSELVSMASRIIEVRRRLAAFDTALDPLVAQNGMFAVLPISPAQVIRLRDEHAIYMAGSGRINLAGLTSHTIERFASALAAVR